MINKLFLRKIIIFFLFFIFVVLFFWLVSHFFPLGGKYSVDKFLIEDYAPKGINLDLQKNLLFSSSEKQKDNLKFYSLYNLPNISKFERIWQVDKDKPVKTNQWFSSLYFSSTSENIFALPLATRFFSNGLSVSLPEIGGNEDLVMGVHDADVEIDFLQGILAEVFETGDFSVGIQMRSAHTDKVVGRSILTHGSPYIFLKLAPNVAGKIVLKRGGRFVEVSGKGRYFWKIKRNGQEYIFAVFLKDGVVVDEVNEGELKFSTTNSSLDENLLTIALIVDKDDLSVTEKYAFNVIKKTEVNFLKRDNDYLNIFKIETENDEPTIFGLLPHQHSIMEVFDAKSHFSEGNCYAFRDVLTIRGRQRFCYGNLFAFSVPARSEVFDSLNLQNFSEEEKNNLKDLVRNDIENFSSFKATDTYFLGKELLRMAHLFELAKQLEMEEEARKIQKVIKGEFALWKSNIENKLRPEDGKYVSYDNLIKGAVGYRTSFGSEEFNDHHFHYGYFIHTAAILGKYDREFVDNYQHFVNLLLKDYVNVNRDDNRFALIRGFDFYEGHSWASGTALFGDGNNQESSSEAIHAYYAAYLWGKVLGEKNLTEVARWLYFQEIDSALTYWLLAKDNSPKYEKYKHSLFSMLWGGKAEFSTWFSGEPEAKLGIQLIPFTAGSEYLTLINNEMIKKHLNETRFPQQKMFFDQLLMYKAIENPKEALKLFEDIDDKDIDGGNSRSFLYAWIVSRLK